MEKKSQRHRLFARARKKHLNQNGDTDENAIENQRANRSPTVKDVSTGPYQTPNSKNTSVQNVAKNSNHAIFNAMYD